jgi:hypothetical protein
MVFFQLYGVFSTEISTKKVVHALHCALVARIWSVQKYIIYADNVPLGNTNTNAPFSLKKKRR